MDLKLNEETIVIMEMAKMLELFNILKQSIKKNMLEWPNMKKVQMN